MPRTGRVFLAYLAVVLSLMSSFAPAADLVAMAPKTWERDAEGHWAQVEEGATPPTTQASEAVQDPELDAIEQLLLRRRGKEAKPRIIRWIKENLGVADRDRGLFLLAEAYNQTGDKVRAFYHLDELMDYYPESRLFFPALEKQFAIADRFLSGYKRRLFGIPFLATDDEGIEILFRIQERAPGSPIAERALLRTADHYYDSSQFDLATDAYGAYASRYSRSPEVPRVRLRRAFSSLAQFRGLRFDVTPVIDAKAQLEDIQAEYPQMAERENVKDVLERIEGILAARVSTTADFYRRTHEPRAAAYNLKYLIENFPDTPEAPKARAQLAKLPASAQEIAAPTGGRATEEKQFQTVGPTTAPAAVPTPGRGETIPPSVDTPAKETP
jgi:outer membrane assembly lipoprotein YfiO